jgi:hypothetical protein
MPDPFIAGAVAGAPSNGHIPAMSKYESKMVATCAPAPPINIRREQGE